MKTKLTFITGQGIHFDNNHEWPYTSSTPTEAHLLLASCEKDYDVHIITTCTDTLHEQAGSSAVVHIHKEADEATIQRCQRLLQESAVVVCLNCIRTEEPLRTVLQGVPSQCRLYNAHYNEGENKFPRLRNLIESFHMSVFAPPAEAVQDILRNLQAFPLNDNNQTN